jgi:hypothetical protein
MVSPVIAFDILNGVLIESNQNSEFRSQEKGVAGVAGVQVQNG